MKLSEFLEHVKDIQGDPDIVIGAKPIVGTVEAKWWPSQHLLFIYTEEPKQRCFCTLSRGQVRACFFCKEVTYEECSSLIKHRCEG